MTRAEAILSIMRRQRMVFLIVLRRQQADIWGDIFPDAWCAPATVERRSWARRLIREK